MADFQEMLAKRIKEREAAGGQQAEVIDAAIRERNNDRTSTIRSIQGENSGDIKAQKEEPVSGIDSLVYLFPGVSQAPSTEADKMAKQHYNSLDKRYSSIYEYAKEEFINKYAKANTVEEGKKNAVRLLQYANRERDWLDWRENGHYMEWEDNFRKEEGRYPTEEEANQGFYDWVGSQYENVSLRGRDWFDVSAQDVNVAIADLAPFLGHISEAAQLYDICKAGERLRAGEGDPYDAAVIKRFGDYNSADKNLWWNVIDGVSQTLKFMEELAIMGPMTGSIKATTEQSMRSTLRWLMTKQGQLAAANKVGQYGLGYTAAKVAGAASGAFVASQVSGGAFEYAVREMVPGRATELTLESRKTEAEVLDKMPADSKYYYSANIARPEDNFAKAYMKGTLDVMIEVMSEEAPELTKALKNTQLADKVVGAAWMKAFAKRNGVQNITKIAKKMGDKPISKAMRFNGMFNEFMEERYGDVARGVFGLEEFSLPTKEQVMTEIIMFGGMQFPASVSDAVATAIENNDTKKAKKLVNKYMAELEPKEVFTPDEIKDMADNGQNIPEETLAEAEESSDDDLLVWDDEEYTPEVIEMLEAETGENSEYIYTGTDIAENVPDPEVANEVRAQNYDKQTIDIDELLETDIDTDDYVSTPEALREPDNSEAVIVNSSGRVIAGREIIAKAANSGETKIEAYVGLPMGNFAFAEINDAVEEESEILQSGPLGDGLYLKQSHKRAESAGGVVTVGVNMSNYKTHKPQSKKELKSLEKLVELVDEKGNEIGEAMSGEQVLPWSLQTEETKDAAITEVVSRTKRKKDEFGDPYREVEINGKTYRMSRDTAGDYPQWIFLDEELNPINKQAGGAAWTVTSAGTYRDAISGILESEYTEKAKETQNYEEIKASLIETAKKAGLKEDAVVKAIESLHLRENTDINARTLFGELGFEGIDARHLANMEGDYSAVIFNADAGDLGVMEEEAGPSTYQSFEEYQRMTNGSYEDFLEAVRDVRESSGGKRGVPREVVEHYASKETEKKVHLNALSSIPAPEKIEDTTIMTNDGALLAESEDAKIKDAFDLNGNKVGYGPYNEFLDDTEESEDMAAELAYMNMGNIVIHKADMDTEEEIWMRYNKELESGDFSMKEYISAVDGSPIMGMYQVPEIMMMNAPSEKQKKHLRAYLGNVKDGAIIAFVNGDGSIAGKVNYDASVKPTQIIGGISDYFNRSATIDDLINDGRGTSRERKTVLQSYVAPEILPALYFALESGGIRPTYIDPVTGKPTSNMKRVKPGWKMAEDFKSMVPKYLWNRGSYNDLDEISDEYLTNFKGDEEVIGEKSDETFTARLQNDIEKYFSQEYQMKIDDIKRAEERAKRIAEGKRSAALDAEYRDVVSRISESEESKEWEEKAEELIRKEAERNGYTVHAFHGSQSKFTEFDPEKMNAMYHGPGFYFSGYSDMAEAYTGEGGQIYEAYLKLENPTTDESRKISKRDFFEIIKKLDPTGDKILKASGAMDDNTSYNKALQKLWDQDIANPIYVGDFGPIDKWTIEKLMDYVYNAENLAEGAGKVMQAVNKTTGIDGYYSASGDGKMAIGTVFHPSQIVSANVEYDNDGNLIPLSERFKRSKDIRGPKVTKASSYKRAAAVAKSKAEISLNETETMSAKVASIAAAMDRKTGQSYGDIPPEFIAAESIKQGNGIDHYEAVDPDEGRATEAEVAAMYDEVLQFDYQNLTDEQRKKVNKAVSYAPETPEEAIMQSKIYNLMESSGENDGSKPEKKKKIKKESKYHRDLTLWEKAKAKANNILSTAGASVASFSPGIVNAGQKYEFRSDRHAAAFVQKITPLIEQLTKLKEENPLHYSTLVRLLQSGNQKVAFEYAQKTGNVELEEALNQAVMTFDLAHAYASEVFPGLNKLDFYFPRRVVDVNGLKRKMYDLLMLDYDFTQDEIDGIETMITMKIQRAMQENPDLTDTDKGKIIEGFIQKEILKRDYTQPGKAPGSTHTKKRVIDDLMPQLMPYYAPLEETMVEYFQSMSRAVEARKLIAGVYYQEIYEKPLEGADVEAAISREEEIARKKELITRLFGDETTMFQDNWDNAVSRLMLGAIENNVYTAYQVERIEKYMKTLFGKTRMGKFAGAVTNLSYLSTLAQFPKAGIRQLGDAGTVMAYNGVVGTLDTATRTILDKLGVNFKNDVLARAKDDVAIDIESLIGDMSIMEKVAEDSGIDLNKATDTCLKFSGLNLVDTFFSNTFIQATARKTNKALNKYDVKVSEDGNSVEIDMGRSKTVSIPLDETGAKVKGLGRMKAYSAEKMIREIKESTGSAFKETIEAMKRGDFTSMDSQFHLYKEISKTRPIGITQQPSAKTTGNDMVKMFYTLKTFSLKFLDQWRQQVFREVKDGIKSGNAAQAANGVAMGARLFTYFAMANATANFLIDLIMNRPLDEFDILIDAGLEAIGVNRWQGYMLSEELKRGTSPQEAILDVIMPPIWNISKEGYKSARRTVKGDVNILQAHGWKFVPFLGIYEAWFGEYAIKYGRNKMPAIWLKRKLAERKLKKMKSLY